MNRADLVAAIRQKGSFLCVGLDTDPHKLPAHLPQTAEGVLEFNKQIVRATAEYAVAFKPNVAFYEAMGWQGVRVLEETIGFIRSEAPSTFIILDAKRGDIGNTSGLYARAAFEAMGVDAVTVAPYMGSDSVQPFLAYEGRWVILLALTSNKGALDFQQQLLQSGTPLYTEVLRRSAEWGTAENMMYVVGATQAAYLAEVRKVVPNHFLLVPGVGAQGGSLEEVCHYGLTDECGLLVNASRSVIFASNGPDYAQAAAHEARQLASAMHQQLVAKGVVKQ